MSDDALIRRANLNRLCKARGWTAADLHKRLWGTYPYWHDLLTSSSKSFGEKAARRIEDELDLPRLWLDAHDAVPGPRNLEEDRASYVSTRWLFSTPLFLAVHPLDAPAKMRLENVMRAHLGLPLLV